MAYRIKRRNGKEYLYIDICIMHSEVTGSCIICVVHYRDEYYQKRVIYFAVDAGLYQEKEYIERNSELPIDVKSLAFIIATHSHADHVGRLPYFVKKGFNNEIYTTPATKIFMEPILKNAVKIQSQKLYNEKDVEKTLELVQTCEFDKEIEIVPGVITATFFKNGHLIGSASILVQIKTPYDGCINLLFTGDYNNKNEFFEVPNLSQDVLDIPITAISEATYGKPTSKEVKPCFRQTISNAILQKKNILIPVFAQGRGQAILAELKDILENGENPIQYPVYIDGTLLQTFTHMHENLELGISEDKKKVRPKNSVNITYANRREIITSPNKKAKIVVSTAGMGTHGPAPEHIMTVLPEKNGLILFTGYLAEGTLGRKLQEAPDNEEVCTIEGKKVTKRAEVAFTTEFSSHAKADELVDFLNKFSNLKTVIINHGSTESKQAFAKKVSEEVNPKDVAVSDGNLIFRINPYGLVKKFSKNS